MRGADATTGQLCGWTVFGAGPSPGCDFLEITEAGQTKQGEPEEQTMPSRRTRAQLGPEPAAVGCEGCPGRGGGGCGSPARQEPGAPSPDPRPAPTSARRRAAASTRARHSTGVHICKREKDRGGQRGPGGARQAPAAAPRPRSPRRLLRLLLLGRRSGLRCAGSCEGPGRAGLGWAGPGRPFLGPAPGEAPARARHFPGAQPGQAGLEGDCSAASASGGLRPVQPAV